MKNKSYRFTFINTNIFPMSIKATPIKAYNVHVYSSKIVDSINAITGTIKVT